MPSNVYGFRRSCRKGRGYWRLVCWVGIGEGMEVLGLLEGVGVKGARDGGWVGLNEGLRVVGFNEGDLVLGVGVGRAVE